MPVKTDVRSVCKADQDGLYQNKTAINQAGPGARCGPEVRSHEARSHIGRVEQQAGAMAGEVVLFRIIKARPPPHCHLTASSVDENPAGLSLMAPVCPAAAAAGLPGTTPTGTACLLPEDPGICVCRRGGGFLTPGPAGRSPRALPPGEKGVFSRVSGCLGHERPDLRL